MVGEDIKYSTYKFATLSLIEHSLKNIMIMYEFMEYLDRRDDEKVNEYIEKYDLIKDIITNAEKAMKEILG